jgi:hypothetical protein
VTITLIAFREEVIPMNEQAVAATIAATAAYGYTIAPRKQHGVWAVVLPPHALRSVYAAAFEAAGVVVLAVIKQG